MQQTKRPETKTPHQIGSQLHAVSFRGDFLAAVEIDLELRTCTHHPCPVAPHLPLGKCLGRETDEAGGGVRQAAEHLGLMSTHS